MRILIKGGVWKNSEDEILKAAVMKYGLNNWSRVASLLIRKSAKQCKARWYEWLDPSVKKTEWTRQEEEVLLHLAKLFPTQWRTIAPIVGRTAHQCLEHYEKLLDKAQGRDAADMDASDPRRLRPGEIDPNPETKPSRADPVDMDDDEKEMLSEARARLANTRGKKAKRKAREKQLEEARRLASLQKRRELKAAGIQVGKMRVRRKYIDYGKEVPFEAIPPAGFYEVGAEETPEGNFNIANKSLQQIEGKRRSEEEERLRKEDRRKLRRLMDDDPYTAMKMIEKLNDPQVSRKRTKLHLPEPQINDVELNEIIELGKTGDASDASYGDEGRATQALLTQRQSAITLGTTPVRTPMHDDTIMLEAMNAVARTQQQTPLVGGENPSLSDTPMPKKGFASSSAGNMSSKDYASYMRTPNPLSSLANFEAGTPAPSGSYGEGILTPMGKASEGRTPYRDDVSESGSSVYDGSSVESLKATKQFLRESLSNLPAPQHEIEVALPPQLDSQDDAKIEDAPFEEDMEDILKRKEAEEMKKLELERLKQSKVLQLGLPRPCVLPHSMISVAAAMNSHPVATSSTKDLLLHSQGIIDAEMVCLINRDAIQYPFDKKAQTLPSSTLPAEDMDYASLQEAREYIEDAAKSTFPFLTAEDSPASLPEISEAWDRLFSEKLPAFQSNSQLKRRYTSINPPAVKMVEHYRRHSHCLKELLPGSSSIYRGLESKYKILTAGYMKRLRALNDDIAEQSNELVNKAHQLEAFKKLYEQEEKAIQSRKNEIRARIDAEKARNRLLQSRYGELKLKKAELLKCLAFTVEP